MSLAAKCSGSKPFQASKTSTELKRRIKSLMNTHLTYQCVCQSDLTLKTNSLIQKARSK